MDLDLFAGMPVTDHARSVAWYEQLLGVPPAFWPHDTEAVWELAEHRYVYVVQQPDRAGRSLATAVVDDLDARVDAAGARGIEPARTETYEGGVRKVTFVDPDGNELALAGVAPPVTPPADPAPGR